MDTTSDAYMYAGVRMIQDFFRHPLVIAVAPALLQVLGAAVIALVLSERWQRMRQRRDFQRDIFSRFSRLSADAVTQLADLLMSRGKVPDDERRRLALQHIRERSALLAMDGELFGFFPKDDGTLYADLTHLKNLARTLGSMAFSQPPTLRKTFEPVQNCLTAQRKVIQSRILYHMGFIRAIDLDAILAEWLPRTQAIPEGVTILGQPDDLAGDAS